MKPRLLDLFCGAGGCTKGYQDAGFYVVGVDINPQPRYVGDEFYQGDALEFVAKHGKEFDAINASPPCQKFSEATPMKYRDNHPDLIAPTRELLQRIGKPYVIENVEGARSELVNPVMLCGTMFGLPMWRHRYFELNWAWLMSPTTCKHMPRKIIVDTPDGSVETREPILVTGGGDGRSKDRKLKRPREKVSVIRTITGMNWMTQSELSQAIPPAYTRWIGQQMMEMCFQ